MRRSWRPSPSRSPAPRRRRISSPARALHAPTLLAYELASVALRKSRLNPHLQPALVAALEDALALDLVWADVDQAAAFELALDLDLTSYDASYLYLARSLGADLVTFDAKLSKAASRLADT